jgi:hypothetical protein
MGTMSFTLPSDLPAEVVPELQRACVAGGPDSMPWPTEVEVEPDRLTVRRDVDESGCLVVPCGVDGSGLLMSTSATLIERSPPYHLQIELARGKVNQLRTQAADWQAGGLIIPDALLQKIQATGRAFARAVTHSPADPVSQQAQAVLNLAYCTAEELVTLYTEQMFEARHQRQPRFDSTLSCRLGAVTLAKEQAQLLMDTCNSLSVSFAWHEIEPAEATYAWEPADAILSWAEKQELQVNAGPLIDFSTGRLPDWLWLWDRDLTSLASFMCDYVETTVKRYCRRIRSWQLTTASNCAAILGLGEDELLWLTARLIEAARQVDPKLDLIVGIAQPWGEYMAVEDRTYSPFIFADTLIRSGLNLTALDVEVVMGVSPRGSYCRDLLDTSRLLDLYTLLGVPLRVTLGYPSAAGPDAQADKELAATAGGWHGGFDADVQADWATAYAGLALCKPSVRAVQWADWSDAVPHQFPHCGLQGAADEPKPVAERLRALRENHLH